MTERKHTMLAYALLATAVAGPVHARPDQALAEDDRGAPVSSASRPATLTGQVAQANWAQARYLPAVIAFGAVEARREEAARHTTAADLRKGPDGAINLSLSTVVDLTLRNNLELLVQSYQPALSAEQLKAREAIFDPLLRFTTSLLSSTNPTSATLEGADVLSQKQGVWNVEAEQYLPAGGTATVGFDNSRQRTNNSFATLNPVYDTSLTFSFSQPLLRNFGRKNTYRDIHVAQNNREVSREAFRDAVIVKVNDAIDAYWDLHGRRETLAVQRAGLKLSQDLLHINRTRVEVGTMAPLDVSTAEAEVARNQQLVITAEFDVANGEDRIRYLINVPRDSDLWTAELRPVDPPVIEERDPDVDASIALALDHRADLRQQSFTIHNAQLLLEAARDELKPSLNLFASYGLAGLGGTRLTRTGPDDAVVDRVPGGYWDALDQLSSFDFDTWRIGVSFEVPLFNKLAEADQAAALLKLREQQDQLDLLKQNAEVLVRRAARAVTTSRKSIEAAGATRSFQEKRLDAERKKFEHGLSTNFEVNEAQKDLTTARTDEVVAVANYRRSIAALARVTGTILESYGVKIEE